MFQKESYETAIVILNWNGKKHLETFLPSVVRYSSEAEIIVADNDSKDDSVAFLKANYPNIRLILLDKNYGFAEGYNRALAQIEAKYFVLLNSDVEVTEGWLNSPLQLLRQRAEVAATGPKILSYIKPEKFEYAGAAGGFIDTLGYPFCRGRIMDFAETDKGQYNDHIPVFWISGAALFIKAEAFRAVKGFDDDFFAHQEEIDLCWRLKHAGYEIHFCPTSVVKHLGGGALPQDSPFKVYLNHRNNLRMLYKNLTPDKLFLTLLTRLFLDGLSAIIYLATFKFRYFWAVPRAHFSFYKNLKTDRKKRHAFMKKYPLKTPKEVFAGSIVWNYFIRNKKRFSQLNF